MIRHLEGDCRQVLPTLPQRSVQCVVTSPPYWRQRSYLPSGHPAKARAIGQEETADEYVETIVGVFRHLARVLVSSGVAWLNLGDKFADKEIAGAAGVKPGDLIGLPWRVALALQADGWFLRSEVIWHKSNAKPEG